MASPVPKRLRSIAHGLPSAPPTPEVTPSLQSSQQSPGASTPGGVAGENIVTPEPRGQQPTRSNSVQPTPKDAEASILLHIDGMCSTKFENKTEEEMDTTALKVQTALVRSRDTRRKATGCVKCRKEVEPEHPMPFCGCLMLCSTCGIELQAKSSRAGKDPRCRGGLGEAYSKALCRKWPCSAQDV